MPLIKSAKKRVKVAQAKAVVNQLHRSGSKTAVRSANRAVAGGGQEAAILVAKAASRLDRAAAKGAIHANKAARLKSRLAAKLKASDLYKLDLAVKQGKADPEVGLELWLIESMGHKWLLRINMGFGQQKRGG